MKLRKLDPAKYALYDVGAIGPYVIRLVASDVIASARVLRRLALMNIASQQHT